MKTSYFWRQNGFREPWVFVTKRQAGKDMYIRSEGGNKDRTSYFFLMRNWQYSLFHAEER